MNLHHFYVQFGPAVRRERVRRKLSLEGLSRKTKVAKATIAKVETGKYQSFFHNIIAISKYLGIQVEQYMNAPESADSSPDQKAAA